MTIPNLYSLTQHQVAMSSGAKLRRIKREAPTMSGVAGLESSISSSLLSRSKSSTSTSTSTSRPETSLKEGSEALAARVQHLELGLRRQSDLSYRAGVEKPITAVLDIENAGTRQGTIKLSLSQEGLALLKSIYVEADVDQLSKLFGQLIDVAEFDGPYLPASINLVPSMGCPDRSGQELCADDVVNRIVVGDYNGEVDCHPALTKAIDYLALNYSKRLSLGDLASHAYVSPSHLSYLFKQHLGLSFKKFLIELRIASAKVKLLNHPRRKVTVIAYEVGFHDLSHFEKTFKRVVGISPGRFRKAN